MKIEEVALLFYSLNLNECQLCQDCIDEWHYKVSRTINS